MLLRFFIHASVAAKLAFQLRYELHRVLAVDCLLLVAHRSEIYLLEPCVIVIIEFFEVVGVLRLSCSFDRLVSASDLKGVLARELNDAPAFLIIDHDKDLLVAEAAEFDGLFQEASLALAEGNVPLRPALDQFQFVYLLLSHVLLWSQRRNFN